MESKEVQLQPEDQQNIAVDLSVPNRSVGSYTRIESTHHVAFSSNNNEISYSTKLAKSKVSLGVQKDLALHAGNIAIKKSQQSSDNAAGNDLGTENIKMLLTNNNEFEWCVGSASIKAMNDVPDANKTTEGTGESNLMEKHINLTKTEDPDDLDESGAADQPEGSDDEDVSAIYALQELRKQNERNFEMLINHLRDPKLEEQFMNNSYNKRNTATRRTNKRKHTYDSSVSFNVSIPKEVRKSLRLQNKKPEYSQGDLDDIEENTVSTSFKKGNFSEECLLENLEEIVCEPKRKRRRTGYQEAPHIIIPVEDVTESMLKNIADRVKIKVYSDYGTTCHQCRQKTLDQKTCCRSPDCVGSRGMFCGICIRNRYGEDCAEALLDPYWICPVCRGKCNCSICRKKQGKRPTGVLAPLAFQHGYKCVDHFLDKLRREGYIPEEDVKGAIADSDPEVLLGFSKDGKAVYFVDATVCTQTCKTFLNKTYEDPENLLGFSVDGTTAVMGGNKHELLFGK